MSEREINEEQLNASNETTTPEMQTESGKTRGRARQKRAPDGGSSLHQDRDIRRMQRKAGFWNRLDLANKFRHWYVGVGSFTRSIFRVVAAWQTIVILGVALIAFYIFTAFYTGKGEFVIQLDRPMANEGFILSETPDFSEWLVSLRDDAVEDADNINITDIADNVMNVDGKHNGENYVAYTFYLKNKTTKTHDYSYSITIRNKGKGADKATWLMLYHNGKQVMYAAPNKDGHEECQYSRWKFPFVEDALNPEYELSTISDEEPGFITQDVINYHEFTSLDGIYQLKTVPFQSDTLVCENVREDMAADEVDKFTVVIWLEGEDPECVNDILGGYVEFFMKFSIVD